MLPQKPRLTSKDLNQKRAILKTGVGKTQSRFTIFLNRVSLVKVLPQGNAYVEAYKDYVKV